jgi:hypothetical protein
VPVSAGAVVNVSFVTGSGLVLHAKSVADRSMNAAPVNIVCFISFD